MGLAVVLSLPFWVPTLQGQTTGQKIPATNTAKLAKLAVPWPEPEALRARRVEAERRPLFAGSEPLAFTLTADFKALYKDRTPNSTKRFDGVITLAGPGGATTTLAVKLGTRGHFRLMRRNCEFAPIRVEFAGNETEGTIFAGQRALKLGTHCQGYKSYEQYTLKEYLTYRIFNLFTPRSFRARLTTATYVDLATQKPIATKYAIFLEDDDDVARRLEGRIAELPRALFSDLDQETLTLMTLYEYMIGNTDYSIYALHNVRLVKTPDNRMYPVPYDFDISGLVHPPYANPDPRLHLASVTERLYRGPCRTAEQLEPFLAMFRSKKNDVLALYDELSDLDAGTRQEAKAYLEEFYSTISQPRDTKRRLVDACKAAPSM